LALTMIAQSLTLLLFPVAACMYVFVPVYCFSNNGTNFESCQTSRFTALRGLMKVIVISGMTPCIITRFLELFTAFTFGCNARTMCFLGAGSSKHL